MNYQIYLNQKHIFGTSVFDSIPTTAEEPDLDGKSDAQVKETEGDSSNGMYE